MKLNRILARVLALLLALAPLCARAESIDETWAFASGGVDVQVWLDGELAAGAGSASDNYVLCLIRAGKSLDYSAYASAAAAKLEAGISNANTRMRTALALMACGATERVPEGVVDKGAGALGAMSWVWALHLLNNGAPSKQFTAESVADELVGLQLKDGGWRVTGDTGDVDVTAMCLQALACCKVESAALDGAVERALDFLSRRQMESGGFASMGSENSESAAQVLIALAGLGVDVDDSRFVKNGRTVRDALMDYRVPSGGFAHLSGGEANPTATAQALQALIALESPGEAFYDFNNVRVAKVEPRSARDLGLPRWKRVALAAIGLLAVAGAAFALTRKRAARKHLAFVLLIALALSCAVWFMQFESVQNYYDPDALANVPADGHVTLSIRCDGVAGRADDGSTPEDGVILPPSEIPFAEGDSVFDALTAAARTHGIHLEYEGSAAMAYVKGINYLYEFAYGELSGWLYYVNGESPSLSCGSCPLHDGDEVLWEYTTDLGGGSR